MQNDLASVEWREFRISDIFDIVDGYYNKKPPQDKNGTIPFLGATQYNNGITTFYNRRTIIKYDKFGNLSSCDIQKRIFKGNCIAITNNGSVGNAYYQKAGFVCSHDVTPVYLKNAELNSYIALFLIVSLKKSGESFEYAKKWRPKRMKTSKIILPIDSKGDPNWRFMEDYMKAIEKEHLEKITAYYNAKLNENNREVGEFDLDEYEKFIQNQKLENIKWKEFVIGEIFEIKATSSGIDKNKLNGKKGNYPYITRSDKINGIDDFIDKQDEYKYNKANVITIGLDTQTAFYQNNAFYTGQNIQILKNNQLNEYNAFFVIVELKKFMEKFNWGGNGATLTRLKRGKILLPTDSKGNLNWQFMKSYIKNIEKKYIKKILNYYNNRMNSFNRPI